MLAPPCRRRNGLHATAAPNLASAHAWRVCVAPRSPHIVMVSVWLCIRHVEDAIALFAVHDDDKSGTIGIREFQLMLASIGMRLNINEMRGVYKLFDANGDDGIDFREVRPHHIITAFVTETVL